VLRKPIIQIESAPLKPNNIYKLAISSNPPALFRLLVFAVLDPSTLHRANISLMNEKSED